MTRGTAKRKPTARDLRAARARRPDGKRRKPNETARERVVESMEGLVRWVEREFPHSPTPKADRLAAGRLGVLDAIDSYDGRNDGAFGAWAMICIRGRMQKEDRGWRTPGVQDRSKRVSPRYLTRLLNEHVPPERRGGLNPAAPTAGEITAMAEAAEKPTAAILDALNARNVRDLPRDLIDRSAVPLNDTLDHERRHEAVRSAVAKLPEHVKATAEAVLAGKTGTEIARAAGLTKQAGHARVQGMVRALRGDETIRRMANGGKDGAGTGD